MKFFAAVALMLVAPVAFAQSSPTELTTAPAKPALIKADAPVGPVIEGSVLRMGLMGACSRAIETAAFNNASYLRGKEIVPAEAAAYRADVAGYIAFACPCVVDTLEKDVGLASATPEKLAQLRQRLGPAMQQTCSKDVYLAQPRK